MPYYHDPMSLRQLDSLNVDQLGVIERIGSAAMSDTARIVVIGIGGMGLKTLGKLKKELQSRVGKIDRNYIRFLSFDTSIPDRMGAITSGSLSAEEVPALDNNAVQSQLALAVNNQPKYLSGIMPKSALPAVFNGDGSNQIRMAGRLSLLEGTQYTMIKTAIHNAISGLTNFIGCNLEVYIVGGVGGGTGSGMIIDIPYITRKVADELGVGHKLRLMGNIFLPDVYETGGDGEPGTGNLDAARRNGYAALKEIDYYMTIKSSGETFDALYPDGPYSSYENIFTTCTLIGGHSSVGYIFQNPKNEAVSVCVQSLINQITRVVGNVNGIQGPSTIADFFTSSAFTNNSHSALLGILNNPNNNIPATSNYNYIITGAASLEFPKEAVVNSFLGKVFSSVKVKLEANKQKLTNDDVNDFEDGTIAPADVVDKAAKEFALLVKREIDDSEHKWKKESILANAKDGTLESKLKLKLTDFETNFRFDDAIAKLNEKAIAIYKDPEKGPYYLADLFGSIAANGAGINGFFSRVNNYKTDIEKIRKSNEALAEDVENNRRELINQVSKKLLGPSGDQVDSYKKLTEDMFVAQFKTKLADWLGRNSYMGANSNHVQCIERRAKEALSATFLSAVDIFEYVSNIIASNAEKASRELTLNTEDVHSILNLKDTALNALQSTILQTADLEFTRLGDQGIEAFTGALLNDMIHNVDDRGNLNWRIVPAQQAVFGESVGADALRSFISNYEPFRAIIGLTLKDYLDAAYQVQPPHVRDAAVQKLLQHIEAHSAPMCEMWGTFNLHDVSNLSYQYMTIPSALGDPNDATSWAASFKNVFAADGLQKTVYYSPDPNMLYSFTMYDKMPAWVDKKIAEYETLYNTGNIPGVHINESPDFTPSYREYPALFHKDAWFHAGQGAIAYTNQKELEYMDGVSKLMNNAAAHGLIEKSETGGYVVVLPAFITGGDKPSDKDVEKFVEKYKSNQDNRDNNGKLKLKNALYPKFCETYSYVKKPIYAWYNYNGPEGNAEAQLAVAKELIRKQMKLLQQLRDAWEFYYENLYKPLRGGADIELYFEQAAEVANYYLFGLIKESRGRVVYCMGSQENEILKKALVAQEGNNAWKADYIEMAVVDKFFALEGIDAHRERLKARIVDLTNHIYDNDEAYKQFEETYKVLAERVLGILDKVQAIEDRGDQLDKKMTLVRDFYSAFKTAIDAIVKGFDIAVIG